VPTEAHSTPRRHFSALFKNGIYYNLCIYMGKYVCMYICMYYCMYVFVHVCMCVLYNICMRDACMY